MNSRLRPILALVRSELRRAVWLLLALTALLALPHQAQAQAPAGICDRTPIVWDAILDRIGGGGACGDVTTAQLETITGTLNLTKQLLPNLKTGDFDGLTNLEELNLSYNILTTLPPDTFRGLTNLEELNLSYNTLTTLPPDTFRGLDSLQRLDLNYNGMTALSVDTFRDLTNLQILNVSSNALTALAPDTFRDLTNLQMLYLFSNGFAALPPEAFRGLTNLQILHLGSNELTTLPADAFRGLDSLRQLSLGRNSLTALSPEMFRGLTNLTFLDIPANKLTALPADVFHGLVNLNQLNLGNNALTAVPLEALRDLANLRSLTLSKNSFTELPPDAFRGLTNVAYLRISDNSLKALPAGLFDGLANLRGIDMSRNLLTALPADLFRDSPNLEQINLSYNSLTALPPDLFQGLPKLRELKLGDNALTTLPADVFGDVPNLQDVDLSFNYLTALPRDLFRGLPKLRTLDLSYNSFRTLPAALLDDLQARVGLDLDLEGALDFMAPEWQPLWITGDSSNRIDLVIVGDAYTASEMHRFARDAKAVQDALFSEDPFQEYANYFNVWRVDVPSNESGASRPGQTPPVMRDTAFDASFDYLLGVNDRKVMRVIGGTPDARDAVLVLVNDPQFGGTGGAIAVASNGGGRFADVALHELGHSLGGLADEYVLPGARLSGPCTVGNWEPTEANVTRQTDPSAIKWRRWIDPATPIPTTTSSETFLSEGVPGLYEGARYCIKGVYRPTLTSKMNDSRAPWKQINTEEWVRVFYDHVSPIDAWTPSTRLLTLPRGVSHTFAVTPMSPATHGIQLDWSVDGAPMGTGSSFVLETTAMTVGDHVVTVRASDETPMVRSDPFEVLSAQQSWTVTILSVDSEPFEIQDRGAASIASNGTGTTMRAGYGRILADAGSTTPSGIAVFQFTDSEGVLISEAGVPATEPARAGRIFAEVNGPVNTGLAIANPNDEPATIDFYFTDTGGARVAEGSFVLGAHQHIAKFLSDTPFNGGDEVLGTFTFASSIPIAVIALRGLINRAGEFLMTTLPVAPLFIPRTPFSTNTENRDTVYFPHFTDGDGWATQVILVNPTARTIRGTVQFVGPGSGATAAAPAILTLDDGRMGSSFDYSIPPRSSQRLTTSNPTGRPTSGSVRATPNEGSAAPSGLVVFSFIPPGGGKTVSEAGVPALPAGSAFRVPVDAFGTPEHPNSIRTGLAIANTATTSTTVTLEVTGIDGLTATTPTTLSLPPSGQVARFIDDFFDSLPENFSGVLRVTSTAQVAVVALRLRINERGELKVTTTTPSNETEASTMADRFFPHIVDSGGWTTQFILFSGTTGEPSSGTLKIILFPPE